MSFAEDFVKIYSLWGLQCGLSRDFGVGGKKGIVGWGSCRDARLCASDLRQSGVRIASLPSPGGSPHFVLLSCGLSLLVGIESE